MNLTGLEKNSIKPDDLDNVANALHWCLVRSRFLINSEALLRITEPNIMEASLAEIFYVLLIVDSFKHKSNLAV